jgi:glucoside 3-dehydrogenase (cytochrome c) hitch-hiker subunit
MNRREALKTGAAIAFSVPFLEAAEWSPSLFTAHQNETVISLIDLIIPATDTPGAKAALVNRYMDLLLKDGDAAERDRFLAGLKWLDDESMRRNKAQFIKLPAAERVELLESMDCGAGEGNEFFRTAKSLTARLYYATETGTKELNKRGIPKSFGCSHNGHHG